LIVASACFSWAVVAGGTSYPRYAAALTPAVLYLLLGAGSYSIPVADPLLALTIFSGLSGVFFESWGILTIRRATSCQVVYQ
jgi:hypothetical protein